MALVAPAVNPVVKLRVYHCGNFLGVWVAGAEFWCRKCRKLVTPTDLVGD